jgi:hypothetical protein
LICIPQIFAFFLLFLFSSGEVGGGGRVGWGASEMFCKCMSQCHPVPYIYTYKRAAHVDLFFFLSVCSFVSCVVLNEFLQAHISRISHIKASENLNHSKSCRSHLTYPSKWTLHAFYGFACVNVWNFNVRMPLWQEVTFVCVRGLQDDVNKACKVALYAYRNISFFYSGLTWFTSATFFYLTKLKIFYLYETCQTIVNLPLQFVFMSFFFSLQLQKMFLSNVSVSCCLKIIIICT